MTKAEASFQRLSHLRRSTSCSRWLRRSHSDRKIFCSTTALTALARGSAGYSRQYGCFGILFAQCHAAAMAAQLLEAGSRVARKTPNSQFLAPRMQPQKQEQEARTPPAPRAGVSHACARKSTRRGAPSARSREAHRRFTYIHTYRQTDRQTDRQIFIDTYICILMCVHVDESVYVCVCVCTHIVCTYACRYVMTERPGVNE